MKQMLTFFFAGDRCPAGWTQLNNRCFIYQNNAETFDQAEVPKNYLLIIYSIIHLFIYFSRVVIKALYNANDLNSTPLTKGSS